MALKDTVAGEGQLVSLAVHTAALSSPAPTGTIVRLRETVEEVREWYALTEEAAAGVVEAPPLTTTMEWRTVSGVRYHIITSYDYEARRDSRVVNSWTLVRRMVRQSTPPVIVDTDD